MSLKRCVVLIVEPEIGAFVTALQEAIDQTGAESVVARDQQSVAHRLAAFTFDAALVNHRYPDVVRLQADLGGVPFVIYSRGKTPRDIVAALKGRLQE